jgi:acyl carrier protein
MMDPLIAVFAEVLSVSASNLNDDSSPDNTSQWDSLAAMHLVAAIEEAFDVELTTADIMVMRSIGKAREVLLAKGVSGI